MNALLMLRLAGVLDLNELFLGNEDKAFLIQVLLRTFYMFIMVLLCLWILGKRGLRELSVFELVILLALGSAAGDPMLYRDVGLLPATLIFVVVVILYRIMIYFVSSSQRVEKVVKGCPVYLIDDGVLHYDDFSHEALAADEFFAELRTRGISQLGQVSVALIETTGDLSVFFKPDDAVTYGLPIMPRALEQASSEIAQPGIYACSCCGQTLELRPGPAAGCARCKHNCWVPASNARRIT